MIRTNTFHRFFLPRKFSRARVGRRGFSTTEYHDGLFEKEWNEIFPITLLQTKAERKFPPEKDPSFILAEPQKRLTLPYLGMDYLAKGLDQVYNGKDPIFAVIKGFGSGKTRFLEELKYEMEKDANILPLTISFSGNSEYSRSAELFIPSNPVMTFNMGIISRIASAFYLLEHNDVITRLHPVYSAVRSQATELHPTFPLVGFFRHIIKQHQEVLANFSQAPTLDRFCLLVDDVMQIQNLFPDYPEPVTISLQQLFASNLFPPVNHRNLILSSDHPKAIFSLQPSTIFSHNFPITSLSIPGPFDSQEVLKTWLLASHEMYPNLAIAAKNLSTYDLVKLELMLNYLTSNPRSIQLTQDYLETQASIDQRFELQATTTNWFIRSTLGIDRKYRPAEYKLTRKFPPSNSTFVKAILYPNLYTIPIQSYETSPTSTIPEVEMLELFRRNFFETSLQVHPSTENRSIQNVLSISPQVSPNSLMLAATHLPNDTLTHEANVIINRINQLFRLKIPQLVDESVEIDAPYFRGNVLSEMGRSWMEIKLLSAMIPGLIPAEEISRREELMNPFHTSSTPTNGTTTTMTTAPQYSLTAAQENQWRQQTISLLELFFHTRDLSTLVQKTRISSKILSQLNDFLIFLPSYTWYRLIPKTFASTRQPFGRKQFFQLLNEIEVSATGYSVQFLLPKLPTEKDIFDVAIILYQHPHHHLERNSPPQQMDSSSGSLPLILFCNFQAPSDHQLSLKKLESYQLLESYRQESSVRKIPIISGSPAEAFLEGNFYYLHFSLLESSSYSEQRAIVLNREDTERFFGMAYPFFRTMRRASKEKLMLPS